MCFFERYGRFQHAEPEQPSVSSTEYGLPLGHFPVSFNAGLAPAQSAKATLRGVSCRFYPKPRTKSTNSFGQEPSTPRLCIRSALCTPHDMFTVEVMVGLTRRSSPNVPPLSDAPAPRTLSILSRSELEMKLFKSSPSPSYSGAARFSLLNREVCSHTA